MERRCQPAAGRQAEHQSRSSSTPRRPAFLAGYAASAATASQGTPSGTFSGVRFRPSRSSSDGFADGVTHVQQGQRAKASKVVGWDVTSQKGRSPVGRSERHREEAPRAEVIGDRCGRHLPGRRSDLSRAGAAITDSKKDIALSSEPTQTCWHVPAVRQALPDHLGAQGGHRPTAHPGRSQASVKLEAKAPSTAASHVPATEGGRQVGVAPFRFKVKVDSREAWGRLPTSEPTSSSGKLTVEVHHTLR
jgi:hypothetical protein